MNNKKFGSALRLFRLKTYHPRTGKPITQEILGQLLGRKFGDTGYTGSTISSWETQKSKIPADDRILLISLIQILREYGGIESPNEANSLLEIGNYRSLNSAEIQAIFPELIIKETSFMPIKYTENNTVLGKEDPNAVRRLRVFLCHASQDKPIVNEMYQELLTVGWVDPWLDKEKILPGQNWDLEINNAVEKSEAVIVFLSKKSVSKEGYVQKEIKKVLDIADEKPEKTLFVIPLRLDDCQLPSRLAKWQYEDYFPDDQRKIAFKRISLSLSARYSQLNVEGNYSQSSTARSVIEWDEKWIEKHRSVAHTGLLKNNFSGFIELNFSLINQKTKVMQKQLLLAAQRAQIHTFGWPIGIVSDAPQNSPKPQGDGLKTEIEFQMEKPNGLIRSYDYWALRTNGDFYLLKSLFEDSDEGRFRKESLILFDTRIHRATEILLYCQRLYNEIGINPLEKVFIGVKYGGLRGRQLSSVKGRFLPRINNVCAEDEIESVVQINLADISTNLVELVKEIVSPLFLLFDFQEFPDSVYEDIVINYAQGKIV